MIDREVGLLLGEMPIIYVLNELFSDPTQCN